MPSSTQPEFPFASLDFPGRTTLLPREVAQRIGISEQHLLDLIDEGALQALNIAGFHGIPENSSAARRYWRIPVEYYRDFILSRMSGPLRRQRLLQLPDATKLELHAELTTDLEKRGLLAVA